jgi:hypothetical protein
MQAAVDYVFNGVDDDEIVAVGMPRAYLRLLSTLAASDFGWLDSSYLPTEVTSEQLATIERGLYQEDLAMRLALGQSISMLQMFPGIIGIWPMSVVDAAGRAIDVSGNGLHLNNNGSPPVNYGDDGAQFLAADSRYLSHADNPALDILGTESHIHFIRKGLTMGCWFQSVVVDLTSAEGIIGKGTTVPTSSSYGLFRDTSERIRFYVSDGVAIKVLGTTVVGASEWNFVAGRYDNSTGNRSMSVVVNDQVESVTTGIPTALNNSSTIFSIGSIGVGGYASGYARLSFLASANVPDEDILRFYETSRVLFP